MNWSTFFTRLGSAIVFCIIMMFGLLSGYYEAMLGLVLLIQFLCLKEFNMLMGKVISTTGLNTLINKTDDTPEDATFPMWLNIITQITGVIALIGIFLFDYQSMFLFLIPLILILITSLHKKSYVLQGFSSIIGLLYISLPLSFLLSLWSIDPTIPVAIILMIWMNDTMAYIVGSFIGKTPFSAISPKKTWEGTLGGIFLTILGAYIYSRFDTAYKTQDWMILSLIVTSMGTIGDLLESKLKRLAGVKDSGNIMPGHGGALDRFDSLLVCIPFAFCYVVLYMVSVA